MPRSEVKQLKAFISYAHEDSALAGVVKRGLKQYGINCFLAHEDIEPTDEWREIILENLKTCNIFLPILTDAAADSPWVQQESGIAAFRRMLIVPLKAKQDPKALLAKYQAFKMPSRITESTFDKLVRLICQKAKQPGYAVSFLIKRLAESDSYNDATEIAGKIEDLELFALEHAEPLLDATISNNQVRGSFKAAPIVRRLVRPYRNDVPHEKWRKFERLMG